MHIIKWVGFFSSLILSPCFASQQSPSKTISTFPINWNTTVRVSTLGLQGEIGYRFNKTFGLRFQGGGLFHERKTLEFDGVKYHDVTIRPQSYNFIADWYFPDDRGYKLSIGGGYNRNKIVLHRTFTAADTFMYNGVNVAPLIGTVKSNYHFSHFTPYAGVGYDSDKLFNSNFSFSIDVGAYFQGKSKASVAATGPIQGDPAGMAVLKQKAEAIVNDSWWLKTYPVISVALRYNF